jgi:hypothetical protein
LSKVPERDPETRHQRGIDHGDAAMKKPRSMVACIVTAIA